MVTRCLAGGATPAVAGSVAGSDGWSINETCVGWSVGEDLIDLI